MGEDKGLMNLGGQPMIAYVLEVLKPLSQRMIIVSNHADYKQFGLPVYQDEHSDKGPLAGIYTGLLHSDHHHNIVVSCDTPFLSGNLLKHITSLAGGFDVSIPRHIGGTEQLMGVYTKACLPTFKQCIESNRLKIKEANELMNYQEILIDSSLPFYDPKIFMNINSQQDFQKALIA